MRGLALLLSAVPLLSGRPSLSEPVAYRLSPVFAGEALTGLRVEVRLRADPSGVTRLSLPDHWAGRRDTWRNLRDLEVEGATQVETPDPAHRKIVSKPDAFLTIRYRMVSGIAAEPSDTEEQPFVPWIRPTWFYGMGPSIFVVPDGREAAAARFDWGGAPAGFTFASDLEHMAGGQRRAMRRGTVEDVVHSVLIGGKDVEVITRADHGASVRIAVKASNYGFSSKTFADQALAVIAQERAFWGGKADPFLVALGPVAVTGGSSISGTNQDDSFAVTASPGAPLTFLKILLAHELFHTWNPRQLGGYDKAEEGRLGAWFGEGFTDFYARRLALRARVIDPQAFAAAWNEMLLAYATSSARAYPNHRIAEDFWSDAEVQKLPYQRGAMLAALWDARLRDKSHGRVSLDDVLKAQRKDAVRRPGTPAPERFAKIAGGFGLDVDGDIARFVDRGEPIVLPADVLGSCGRMATETRPVFDLGFDGDATAAAGMVIKGVRSGSNAYAAGLRNGMRLIKREAGTPGDATSRAAFSVVDAGERRVVTYLPAGEGTVRLQQFHLTSPLRKDCARSLSGG